MSEDIADRFKRGSALKKMKGVRMPKTVGTLVGNIKAAGANQRLKGFGDVRWFQDTNGRTHSHEDFPIRSGWRRTLQMFHQRG
jgi:hypothetical protein